MAVSNETLMRQAPMTIDEYLRDAVTRIDSIFGDGYAKNHPELTGDFITACATDYHSGVMTRACEERDIAIGAACGELRNIYESIDALQ